MMASDAGSPTKSRKEALTFFRASRLEPDQAALWREFATGVPWAHYFQDPAWAEIERRDGGIGAREPWFFWVESQGTICLTAIGVKRRLPVPGRVFWEFKKGPIFVDPLVLDEWLPWLMTKIGRGAARVRMAPPVPLEGGGDDVETVLERHGFVRRRTEGGWATLLVDLSGGENDVMARLRPTTRQRIQKSRPLAVVVQPEDSPDGWRDLAGLQTELSRTASVPLIDESTLERISRHWFRGDSGGTVLVARHGNEALAAALVVRHRDTAYLEMMPSSHRQRELPASHLLLWEALCWAGRHGCSAFDLVGYSLVARPGDSLWGVNEFKRGFASLDHLRKSVAVHEAVLSPTVVALAGMVRRYQTRMRRRRG